MPSRLSDTKCTGGRSGYGGPAPSAASSSTRQPACSTVGPTPGASPMPWAGSLRRASASEGRDMARPTEPPYLHLTTTGRRSGQARASENRLNPRDGRYYVIAETGASARWVQNLRADPCVHWRVMGITFSGQARIVDATVEPVLNEAVQALSCEKYGWGEGLVVELIPDADA